MKKIIFFLVYFLCFAQSAFAITLLIEDEALARIFPEGKEIIAQKITASNEQLAAIKKALGGNLVHELRTKEAAQINGQQEFIFYLLKNIGEIRAAAIILDEPGKWGPIKFIIRLSGDGKIEDAAVMKYTETRGRPVASGSFLRQFIGKSLSDPIKLNEDIQAVSGATISSIAACFTMRKAIVLYKALILGEKAL